METFGFKSKFLPKQEEKLKHFENAKFNFEKQSKFRKVNRFQELIKKMLRLSETTNKYLLLLKKTT